VEISEKNPPKSTQIVGPNAPGTESNAPGTESNAPEAESNAPGTPPSSETSGPGNRSESPRRTLIFAPIPDTGPLIKLVHGACLVISGIVLLALDGRGWFYLDEWDFLVNRRVQLGGTEGILSPHNEHWSTIPILVWRGLFSVVGVSNYWLYALPMILLHLLAAHLLWRIMIRHKVEPWIATFLAATFMLLGAGWQNLVWAFQIGFVGTLAFGLLAIEAVENDNLWLPSVWCICSLMCTDVGVPMVIATVIVAITRRRFRIAAVTALVPGLVFALWWAKYSPRSATFQTGLHELALYVWTGLTSALASYLYLPRIVGDVLVILLAAGAIWRRSVPAALAVSAVPLLAFIGTGRALFGASEATSSRYSYLVIALAIPLVGQLLTTISRSVLVLSFVFVALIAVFSVNLSTLVNNSDLWNAGIRPVHQEMKRAAFLIARGSALPPEAIVYNGLGWPDSVSVGQLTRLIRSGRFAVPDTAPPGTTAEEVSLGVYTSRERGHPGDLTFSANGVAGTHRCVVLDSSPLITALEKPGRTVYAAPGVPYASAITVRTTGPGSLLLEPAPRTTISSSDPPFLVVTMEGPDGIFLPSAFPFVLPADHWINLPGVGYESATVASYDGDLMFCQAAGK